VTETFDPSRPALHVVIITDTNRSATHDFLLVFHSNYGLISYRFQDKWQLAIFFIPVHLMPPLRRFPLEFFKGGRAQKLEWCPYQMVKQEAQLMLTNPRDAFSGQSRSPNIVPFHMLGIVSSWAIVTLSLRGAVFTIFDFKKCRDLEIGVRDHSRSLKVASFEFRKIVYGFLLVFFSNFVAKRTVFEILNL